MLILHHPNPLSREKDKPLYLGYWVPLAKTLPFSGFLCMEIFPWLHAAKNYPTFPRKLEYTCGPLMHSSEGGGGGRFGKTCMTKKQSEMLIIEPSLCLAVAAPGRTLYVQAVILRNLILTLKFHIVLARLCVDITAHIWCQMKEDELNFVTIKTIFHKIFNFSGKITALSGFLFIGTHCIYKSSFLNFPLFFTPCKSNFSKWKLFTSPEPKAQVSYCRPFSSVVRRP